MVSRNIALIFLVIIVHLGAIWGLATLKSKIEPPKVLTVSLLGSVMQPAAAQALATTQPETQAAAQQETPPAPEPPPTPEPVPEPQPEPEPVPETPKPPPEPETPKKIEKPKPEKKTEKPPKPPKEKPVKKPAKPVDEQPKKTQTDQPAANAPTTGKEQAPKQEQPKGDPEGATKGTDAEQKVTQPSTNASSLNNAKPAYPPMSRRLKEEGTVILHVLVSAEGKAKNVKVKRSSGYPRLDQSAENAVRYWRFIPAKRGNTPIDMSYDLPIKFSLKD